MTAPTLQQAIKTLDAAERMHAFYSAQSNAWAVVKGRLAAAAKAVPATELSFQSKVANWMGECFIPSLYSNMTERGDRLLEEVLELLQSKSYDRARIATLTDYVWNRPVGEPAQEVGGVMVTLAGFCWIADLDMHAAGEAELTRITQPEVMAKIRAKQEAKNALHFDTPLSGNAGQQSAAQHAASVTKEDQERAFQAMDAVFRKQFPAELNAEDKALAMLGIRAALESFARGPAAQPSVPLLARAKAEWHENDGPVVWWAWCGHEWAGEPAWCGTPLDSDWPGYHTHWTPHPSVAPLPSAGA